ncbi:MAG TPA: hypothetical protein VFU02_19605 [Polyangiaceae bacterium]|nr:hypothetical protein [Polyangiaceae bacterium]
MAPLRLVPQALRSMTVTYSKSDVAAVSLIAAVVAVWAAIAGRAFSIRALLACQAMFFAFYLVGSVFAGLRCLAAGILWDLPLRLLVGYAVVNTALLVLAWLSPLGMLANFGVLLAIAAFVFFSTRERKQHRENSASLWVVGISAVATTLWCQDSIDPTADQGNVVVFKPWVDGFYHAVHIRIFAESHGAASIEDFRMAGVPARLYHYGAYMLPAVVKQASAIHSYAAFAGILAPVGVFFTGLAAYAFFGSLWGAWPGLAATMALLLLPDGAQQGMQNTFMSYHWLTQISPSATYGLALLAVAWLFVIRGCTEGSRQQLLVGWLVAGVLVLYKLHYVIASALLLLLVPALFFRGAFSRARRALGVVAACAVYAAALFVAQKVPGVPAIRFDGSSIGEILRLIQTFATPGPLKEAIVQHTGTKLPWASNLLFGIPYVSCASLGLFLPLLVVLMLRLRGRAPLLHVLFPLILVANFLVMFFGLALDFESSTPDELSHRPVMIVYFFVVSWVGGAVGLLIVNSRRLEGVARPALVGSAAVLMAVPAFLGSGVQLLWAMPRISPVRVPSALVRVAEYLRTHGGREDIFQDSQFDRTYAIAALSERRSFVSHTMTRMPFRGETVAARTAAIDRLMGLAQPKLVVGTARAYGVRWFILHKGNRVNWPPELADHPKFEQGSFTVYEF